MHHHHGFPVHSGPKNSIFSTSRLTKLHWDGESPPARVEQVWNYLTFKLRDFREAIANINDLYYGRHERTSYVKTIHNALREMQSYVSGTSQVAPRIANLADLKDLLQAYADRESLMLSPRKAEKTKSTVEKFITNVKVLVEHMTDLRADFEEEILQRLSRYCSNYVSLGIADDDFFVSLSSRTMSIRDVINQFDMLIDLFELKNTNSSGLIPPELFSDHDFSLEVSIIVKSDVFQVIRIPTDLIQKLEDMCDIAHDWLRSDKVYLDQIQKEIESTRGKLSALDTLTHGVKLQYDELYAQLKDKQVDDHTDDLYGDVCKDISKLEATRARLDMDMAAVEKTLKNTRDTMTGVSSASTHTTSSRHRLLSGTLLKRRHSQDDGETVVSAAHSSYMSRLNNDIQHHLHKLKTLKHKRLRVDRKINEKRTHLARYESRETDVHQLGKRLRLVAKNKSKLTSQMHTLRARIDMLEHVLRTRMRPASLSTSTSSSSTGSSGRTQARKVLASKRHSYVTKLNMPTTGGAGGGGGLSIRASHRSKGQGEGQGGGQGGGQGRSKRSADLYKAFRIVKNGIGYAWKDLVRSLPYSPAKELIELNNEITAIEYRNKDQLREQPFQALMAWYAHCGRKASVEELCSTLREINENRLADNIEKVVLKIDSASDSGRR